MIADAVHINDDLRGEALQHAFQKSNHSLALCSRRMRKLKCALSLLIVAAVERSAADETWHLLIEPTFMHYEATWPIDRAERTVLVPARYVNGEVLPLKSDDILTLGATRDKILARSESRFRGARHVDSPLHSRRKQGHPMRGAGVGKSIDGIGVLAPEFASLFARRLAQMFSLPSQTVSDLCVSPEELPLFNASRRSLSLSTTRPHIPSAKSFSRAKRKATAIGSYR